MDFEIRKKRKHVKVKDFVKKNEKDTWEDKSSINKIIGENKKCK